MKIFQNYFKIKKHLQKNKQLLAILFLFLVSIAFFWKYFLQNLVPIPADIIVGIYFPWRDQIWNGFNTGVPFKNGHLSDIVSIIIPWRFYGISLMQEGLAPLWIPHALGGSPLLANFQSGLLYPINILFWVLEKTDAWSIYIILQPIFASIFAYLFLQNLKLSSLASLFGAFIFAFSGFALVWLEYGIVGHSGLWLPLILLSIDKFVSKRPFRWVALCSLAFGFSFLAGYPQISFFISGIAVIYMIFRVIENKKKIYLLGFLSLILGIGLASAQLIPGFELMSRSIRLSDPTAAAFNFGILPLNNLILVLVPDFFGNPATGNYWDKIGYNESAFYIGISGLIFLINSFFIKEKKKALFFYIILISSLFFVFDNPIAKIPQTFKIPGLSAASAGRFLFLTTFSMSVLVSFGVEEFLLKQNKKIYFAIGFILLSLAIIWINLLNTTDQNLIISKRNLILPTLLFFASFFLLAIGFYLNKLKYLITPLLLLILIFDLFRFGWKYNSFSSKEFLYPQTKINSILQEKIGINRFYGEIPQSMFIPYNFSSPEGYEPLMNKKYSEFANLINQESFNKLESGSRWVIVNNSESPLLDLMGVKYLLNFNGAPSSKWDHQEFKYSKEKYQLIAQEGFSQIYERKNSLPRIFITQDYQVAKKEDFLPLLMNKNTNLRVIYFEKAPDILLVNNKGNNEVLVNEQNYWKNIIEVDTESEEDGYLFISDTYYPGWKAFVDGNETKIYEADYIFRAIFLPKGNHKVNLVYKPTSFKIGLVISLFSLLLIAIILIYEHRRFSGSS